MYYGLAQRGMKAGEEVLKDCFVDAWNRELGKDVPVLFDQSESRDRLKDLGKAMIDTFMATAPAPHVVLAVEEAFRAELHDPETGEVLPDLVGRFDAVVEDEKGRRTILEHKTAARRYAEDKLEHDLQPTAYALAAKLLGLGEVAITYQVLLKQRKPSLVLYDVTRSKQDHHDFLETVAGVTRAVEARAFFPQRGWWCRSCQYAGPCLAG
jgi:hypothetical protein